MSAMGHKQTSRYVRVMSVISLKADIHQHGLIVATIAAFHPVNAAAAWLLLPYLRTNSR
jgi:tryptophan-rich sensory protein